MPISASWDIKAVLIIEELLIRILPIMKQPVTPKRALASAFRYLRNLTLPAEEQELVVLKRDGKRIGKGRLRLDLCNDQVVFAIFASGQFGPPICFRLDCLQNYNSDQETATFEIGPESHLVPGKYKFYGKGVSVLENIHPLYITRNKCTNVRLTSFSDSKKAPSDSSRRTSGLRRTRSYSTGQLRIKDGLFLLDRSTLVYVEPATHQSRSPQTDLRKEPIYAEIDVIATKALRCALEDAFKAPEV